MKKPSSEEEDEFADYGDYDDESEQQSPITKPKIIEFPFQKAVPVEKPPEVLLYGGVKKEEVQDANRPLQTGSAVFNPALPPPWLVKAPEPKPVESSMSESRHSPES